MRWKDAPNPDLPLFASNFPRIVEFLERAPDGTGKYWFILEADDWDALLGDTVREYFQGAVFDSGSAAEAWILALEAEARLRVKSGEPGVRYTLRSFNLRREGSARIPSGHESGPGHPAELYLTRMIRYRSIPLGIVKVTPFPKSKVDRVAPEYRMRPAAYTFPAPSVPTAPSPVSPFTGPEARNLPIIDYILRLSRKPCCRIDNIPADPSCQRDGEDPRPQKPPRIRE